MSELQSKVVLIGGAPGAGKTTLGFHLARRIGVTSLSADDLMLGAQAVTDEKTHPALHVMRRVPSIDYFTTSSIEQLKDDAKIQHEAVWPIVERVIRVRAESGAGVVIDGWHMTPSFMAGLSLPSVTCFVVVTAIEVLEERERNNKWFSKSSDPERMLNNFLARSIWSNQAIHADSIKHGIPALRQDGSKPAESLCDEAIEVLIKKR